MLNASLLFQGKKKILLFEEYGVSLSNETVPPENSFSKRFTPFLGVEYNIASELTVIINGSTWLLHKINRSFLCLIMNLKIKTYFCRIEDVNQDAKWCFFVYNKLKLNIYHLVITCQYLRKHWDCDRLRGLEMKLASLLDTIALYSYVVSIRVDLLEICMQVHKTFTSMNKFISDEFGYNEFENKSHTFNFSSTNQRMFKAPRPVHACQLHQNEKRHESQIKLHQCQTFLSQRQIEFSLNIKNTYQMCGILKLAAVGAPLRYKLNLPISEHVNINMIQMHDVEISDRSNLNLLTSVTLANQDTENKSEYLNEDVYTRDLIWPTDYVFDILRWMDRTQPKSQVLQASRNLTNDIESRLNFWPLNLSTGSSDDLKSNYFKLLISNEIRETCPPNKFETKISHNNESRHNNIHQLEISTTNISSSLGKSISIPDGLNSRLLELPEAIAVELLASKYVQTSYTYHDKGSQIARKFQEMDCQTLHTGELVINFRGEKNQESKQIQTELGKSNIREKVQDHIDVQNVLTQTSNESKTIAIETLPEKYVQVADFIELVVSNILLEATTENSLLQRCENMGKKPLKTVQHNTLCECWQSYDVKINGAVCVFESSGSLRYELPSHMVTFKDDEIYEKSIHRSNICLKFEIPSETITSLAN